MNSNWSQYIQTSEELYRSRALRFHDGNKEKWISQMRVANGMNVLDVGCGSGLFCHRIKTYLPNSTVTGLDFDTGHIGYAKVKTRELGIECNFVNGDATALPFEQNTFDVCYSYTVMEHIEPNVFLKEQYRVLKQNGTIVILSVRPELNINSENWKPGSGEENELLTNAWKANSDFKERLKVCQYPLKEHEILVLMEKNGFKNINIDFMSFVHYAPNNENVSKNIAIESINVNRLFTLNSMKKALRMNPTALTKKEYLKLEGLINQRYDKRILKYLNGKKLWDISTSTMMIATGQKID